MGRWLQDVVYDAFKLPLSVIMSYLAEGEMWNEDQFIMTQRCSCILINSGVGRMLLLIDFLCTKLNSFCAIMDDKDSHVKLPWVRVDQWILPWARY